MDRTIEKVTEAVFEWLGIDGAGLTDYQIEDMTNITANLIEGLLDDARDALESFNYEDDERWHEDVD